MYINVSYLKPSYSGQCTVDEMWKYNWFISCSIFQAVIKGVENLFYNAFIN